MPPVVLPDESMAETITMLGDDAPVAPRCRAAHLVFSEPRGARIGRSGGYFLVSNGFIPGEQFYASTIVTLE